MHGPCSLALTREALVLCMGTSLPSVRGNSTQAFQHPILKSNLHLSIPHCPAPT